MNILSGLDAQIESVLHLFEPLGRLVKGYMEGTPRGFRRGQDLLLHSRFIDIWREVQLFHDVADDELCSAVTMTHACLCHWLWKGI